MIDKKQIQNIKTNIERTIQGLVAKPKEFTYKETGGFVRNKMTYSIYYTLNKDEVYLTGTTDSTNSQIIEKVNDKTMFSEYKDLASLTRTPYPKTTPAKPTESDYEIGEITRYFTQVANDKTKPIGKEIIKRSKVLSKPDKTSTKLRNNNDWFKYSKKFCINYIQRESHRFTISRNNIS